MPAPSASSACRRGPRGSRRRRPPTRRRSRIRFASAALRASGLVHSTALPAAATAAIASSCMSLGRPTTTVSTAGSSIASSMLVVALGHTPPLLERLAALDRPRVDDLDAVAAAPAVQRHRVEVADQPGAEHGDAVVSAHRGPSVAIRSTACEMSRQSPVAAASPARGRLGVGLKLSGTGHAA